MSGPLPLPCGRLAALALRARAVMGRAEVPTPRPVIGHDLGCGADRADLPLYAASPRRAGGPVLDVGAGAGRVALDLARRGVGVVALDRDAVLLAALRERAAGLPVTIVKGDAGAFQLGPRFALVLGPMQTVQLLRGAGGRARFLRCAARHLRPGVLLAAALAEELEDFSPALPLPPPDMARDEGWTWTSQPTGLHGEGPAVVLERVRETVAPDRRRSAEDHAMRLDRLTARVLEEEATAAGLRPLPRRATRATEERVGRTVVVVRG